MLDQVQELLHNALEALEEATYIYSGGWNEESLRQESIQVEILDLRCSVSLPASASLFSECHCTISATSMIICN